MQVMFCFQRDVCVWQLKQKTAAWWCFVQPLQLSAVPSYLQQSCIPYQDAMSEDTPSSAATEGQQWFQVGFPQTSKGKLCVSSFFTRQCVCLPVSIYNQWQVNILFVSWNQICILFKAMVHLNQQKRLFLMELHEKNHIISFTGWPFLTQIQAKFFNLRSIQKWWARSSWVFVYAEKWSENNGVTLLQLILF